MTYRNAFAWVVGYLILAAILALSAFHAPHHGAVQRPMWDGRGTYASGVQPFCPAADRGHHAVAGVSGHRFTAVCTAAGDGWYVWDARP